MPTAINPALKTIQSKIAGLDVQAKKDQGVQDSDIKKVMDDIDTLSKTDGADKSKLGDLKNKLSSMATLAAEPEKGTADTNARWDKGFAEMNSLLADMGAEGTLSQVTGGHGTGTAFKGLTADQAKTAGLPDSIAKLQSDGADGGKQQVNKVQDGAGKSYYVASGNGSASNTYTVYDDAGTSMGTMKAPGALGLNDGKTWLALSKDGIGKSWTTTDPKSLPENAEMFDLNGAAGNGNKIVARGANAGGAAATAQAADAATAPAGSAKIADSAHSAEDNKPGGSNSMVKDGTNYKFWAGATSSAGTVFADVMTPLESGDNGTSKNNIHWTKLKDEAGKDITPPELNRGQYGKFTFDNGSQYISSDKGYFMVAGGVAKDITTGKTITDPKEVADIVASAPTGGDYSQAKMKAKSDQQAEEAKKAQDDYPVTM